MPSIYKRGNSYLVTISNGFDMNGNRIKVNKSFLKPDNISEKNGKKNLKD